MFSQNLSTIRKNKGLSQQELAEQLHVVRQTISKWEKALSVPDAEMLIRLGEILEVPVSTLLGETIKQTATKSEIAESLEELNAQLSEKNRRNRRICKTLVVIAITILLSMILLMIFNAAS